MDFAMRDIKRRATIFGVGDRLQEDVVTPGGYDVNVYNDRSPNTFQEELDAIRRALNRQADTIPRMLSSSNPLV